MIGIYLVKLWEWKGRQPQKTPIIVVYAFKKAHLGVKQYSIQIRIVEHACRGYRLYRHFPISFPINYEFLDIDQKWIILTRTLLYNCQRQEGLSENTSSINYNLKLSNKHRKMEIYVSEKHLRQLIFCLSYSQVEEILQPVTLFSCRSFTRYV